jgi:hypothetical protein
MLTGIHVLLTYACNFECDHCFLYAGPNAKGTFTISQIRQLLDEASKIGTVEIIYFEGGESFLYYPIMLEGIRIARDKGFKTGVVTNGYYGESVEDAEIWLRPLRELGIDRISISDDSFHYEDGDNSQAKRAIAAAEDLGLPVNSICIEKPVVEENEDDGSDKGEPVIGGGARFRGRAVEKLAEGLPKRSWKEFTECPDEDLENPKRVHVDSYGNVHLCQGLSMGNMWETPLSVLVENYHADSHPIAGPLAKGGPALLAKEYEVEHADEYVDACHLCFALRVALIDRFPQYLAPRQVYGLD